jgi:hypothetical protein
MAGLIGMSGVGMPYVLMKLILFCELEVLLEDDSDELELLLDFDDFCDLLLLLDFDSSDRDRDSTLILSSSVIITGSLIGFLSDFSGLSKFLTCFKVKILRQFLVTRF